MVRGRTWWISGCAVVLWAAVHVAVAEVVYDPTRPYTGHPDLVAPQAGSLLQSTVITPTGNRAVIAGRTYRVGDRYGRETLIAILPYAVRLKAPDGRVRVLRMLPKLVEKTNKDKNP